MPDHLYRFRSIEKLLDSRFKELELQEIYFSSRHDLNDPLEGFTDIFWRGDNIVWKNFLRHYLLVLLQAIFYSGIVGQEFKTETIFDLVFHTDEDLPKAPIREIYTSICQEFFDHPAPKRLITEISSQQRTVRRNELIFYLRSLHILAIRNIFKFFYTHDLMPFRLMKPLDSMIDNIDDVFEKILSTDRLSDEISDTLYSISESMASQIALIHEIGNSVSDERQSWMFINRDFPSFYVNAIEQLIFPDWHVACFAANPTNASMWGTYGEGHKGICLKFKTQKSSQGHPTLNLNRVNSFSGKNSEDITQNYSYRPHDFTKIEYTAGFPEIDFFQSLGRLSFSKLNGFWFAGQNGEQSIIASRILQEQEAWRQEYWRNFVASYSNKSPEWAHEDEYRLIIDSSFDQFDTVESRKLKYRFSDLEGIIFGIKTTTADKLTIMRIIETKCTTEERRDFEFSQAYYNHRTRKIELAPLSLLKMK